MNGVSRNPRPSTEQLHDLHVYVIPPELWRQHLRSAANEVITDSISLGFLRVSPNILLNDLRNEIPTQLGDDYLPKDYAFLKSVGRCLTQVKSRQERELKVKHFLPPYAYTPEVFILDSHAEAMRDSPSTIFNQSISGGTTVAGNKQDSGRNSGNNYSNFNRYPSSQHMSPLILNDTPRVNQYRQSRGANNQHDSQYFDGSLPDTKRSIYPSFEQPYSHDISALTNAHRNQINYDLSGGTTYRKDYNNSSGYKSMSSPHKLTESMPNEMGNGQNLNNDYYSSQNQKQVRSSDGELHHSDRRTDGKFVDETRSDGNKYQHDSQASLENRTPDYNIHSSQNFPQHDSNSVNQRRYDDGNQRWYNDNNQTGYDDNGSQENDNNANQVHSDKRHDINASRDQYNLQNQDRELMSATPSTSNALKQSQQHQGSAYNSRYSDDEARDMNGNYQRGTDQRGTVPHGNHSTGRKSPSSYERADIQQRNLNDAERDRNERVSDSSTNKNRKVSKGNLELLKQLEEARNQRLLTERKREELVKKARAMQAKTNNRRNQAREVWKRKYYEAKKSTPGLESECQKIRSELDTVHRKYLSVLENTKHTSKDKDTHQADAVKLQYEVDELQRKADAAKMKLTAEMKLRNQAETELRALRAELTQKKMNVNISRAQRMNAISHSMNPSDSSPVTKGGAPVPLAT